MIVIKNSKELAELVDENKDLSVEEDVRIEYQFTAEELRDVKCRNLYLQNDQDTFNFNGGDFNGGDFKGRNFNGKNPTYAAAHSWIKKYNGNAKKCENREYNVLYFSCSNKSNNFQWAKKKGRRYSRDIDDYYQLCVSCHSKYDAPKLRKCKLDNCDRKRRRYEYCEKHGIRFKKYGSPYKVKLHTGKIKILID